MSQVISSPSLIGKRYQLGELLGQGGMGAVYRAVDRLTGQMVALKRVISLTEAQSQQSRSDSISFRLALTREFKVLASLRHPNIISVLDYGFDDERQPYITMELLDEAQTVLTVATEQTLQQQIHLLIELLQALAYLHRREILHRDLKPSNVLVTPDGYLKVLDFGLAAESEQAKDMAGTLAYMAPEVMQGQQATSGVDLYAVGVMAYEIFTGRHPFNTDNMQKLVWDVLNSAPDLQSLVDRTTNVSAADSQQPTTQDGNTNVVGDNFKTMIGSVADNDYEQNEKNIDDDTITLLPDDIRTDNSPDLAKTLIPSGTFNIADEYEEASLAAIVGKLLSKSPEVRYSRAYDVIVDLASALNISVPQESAAVRESFLQAATFVGREVELKQLETALESATQGQGSAWLIAGESGVGKSRLIEELRIRALSHGVMVLRGQAVSEGGLSYQLWREPVRRLLLTTDVSDLDASILKEIVPDIGMLLERNIADVIPLEGTAEQQRLLGTIINLFERQNQPVMLILEDLHWSGESLDVLRLLNGMVGDLPLLIVANYRHEDRPDLPKELPEMGVLRLERLSENDISQLSASMLGEAGRQPAIIELLRRETEGNVFFLVEVVRALAEEAGGLSNIGRMSLPQNVLAGGVQKIIQRRLERIPEDGRSLLRLAAIHGREIDVAVLDHVKDAADLDEWLTICVNYAVLEVQDGRYRFAHDKLREAVLASIPTRERAGLHRRIAEAIEHIYSGSPEQAPILSQHWRAAGDDANEFRCVQIAGDYALHVSALSDAIRHFERALELLSSIVSGASDQKMIEADLRTKLGEALQYAGDYDRANKQITNGLDLYRSLGDKSGAARSLNLRGDIYWRIGNYGGATQACVESLELYRSFDDKRGIARALNRLGMVSFDQGDYINANEQIQEALYVANSNDDQIARSMSMNNLGLVALRQGDYENATRYFEENLAISRESGERWKVASALHNLGTLAGIQGNLTVANDYFEQALTMCKSIGDRRGVALALENIGFVAQLQGDYVKATRYLEESLLIARVIGNRQGSANTLLNLGHLATAQGDKERASDFYYDALQIAHEIEALPVMLEVLCGLARLESDKSTALRWLGVVLSHPATSQDTRDMVGQVLEELRITYTPEEIEAGIDDGKNMELEAVVVKLLEE